jgi:hypothetical protein
MNRARFSSQRDYRLEDRWGLRPAAPAAAMNGGFMKTDKELVQEYLSTHEVKRIPARRNRPSRVQFRGHQSRGVKRLFAEILRDHRLDPEEKKE